MFSDSRLKKNVRHLRTVEGVGIVEFEWNDKARELGQINAGKCYGVIAQQAQELFPGAVAEHDGYLEVNYGKLPKKVREAIRQVGGY
jgi:hypothetical protein